MKRRAAAGGVILLLAGCGLSVVGVDLASAPADAGADVTPSVEPTGTTSVTEPDAALPADAGGPIVLYVSTSDAGVRAVAVDNGRMFLIDHHSLAQVQIDGGGTPTILVDNVDLHQLAVKGDDVWYTGSDDGHLHRFQIDSGVDTAFAGAASSCIAIDPDGTKIWVANYDTPSSYLVAYPTTGDQNPLFYEDAGIFESWGVGVGASAIYFTVDRSTVVRRDAKDGTAGNDTIVADAQANAQCITDDNAGHIYWPTYDGDGGIFRAGADGTNATQIASGQVMPTQVAIDANYIYWNSGGAVMRMARPQ